MKKHLLSSLDMLRNHVIIILYGELYASYRLECLHKDHFEILTTHQLLLLYTIVEPDQYTTRN